MCGKLFGWRLFTFLLVDNFKSGYSLEPHIEGFLISSPLNGQKIFWGYLKVRFSAATKVWEGRTDRSSSLPKFFKISLKS